MDVCMRLAAGSLDVNRVYLEHCERDCGALFLWPTEGGEVETPSLSAARGCYDNVVKTLPWAQVRPWRSQISLSSLVFFVSSSVNLVNRGVNEVNQRPIIANERPATSVSLRKTSTVDTGTQREAKTDRPQPLLWRSRWDKQCCHGFSLHPGKRQPLLPSTQSSVTGGSFLSSVLASPHILGQPFFGLQPFTRGFPLG
ncbi:hypothetical protein Taro_003958 [Colocasia esculenta]|uniref:Uncharacterized protein n=1 Tax=Colocasia esculenta TaxID=4460 RepID=A0A843TNP2_COLES|nr:hypothetical protein [Colocasia esculenta]